MHIAEVPKELVVAVQSEQSGRYAGYRRLGGVLDEGRYNAIIGQVEQAKEAPEAEENIPRDTLIRSQLSVMAGVAHIKLTDRVKQIYDTLYQRESDEPGADGLTGDQRLLAEALRIAGEGDLLKTFRNAHT